MTTQLELFPNDATLPDGWQRAKVADVCEFIDYGYTASANFTVTTPKFLRITDIQNGRVNWEAVPGCEITTEDEEANRLRDGDIVFARTGGTTGKSFLIREPPRAVFASYLIRLRPNERVTSDFIYAFFQSNDYWQQVNAHARGGAQPNVNATLLGSMTMPLPPLAEQKRIAGILKQQLAAVERAQAAAEAQLEAAKALPAAHLRSRFDTPEAMAWPRKQIADFAKTCSGATPSRDQPDFYDGNIPWVKTAELRDGDILDTEEHVSEVAVERTSLRLLPSDTLLIAMYGQGQTRGRTGRLMCEATTNQACFAILPNQAEYDTAYVQCWFRHNYLNLRNETESRGGNQPNLNGVFLRKLQIPFPSLETQREITASVAEYDQQSKKVVDVLRQQLHDIDAMPAALLRAAFQGQL